MATLYLVLALVGALGAWNALYPVRWPSPLGMVSFFWGWFTSELAVHVFLWNAALALFFVWCGALAEPPGQLGLGLSLMTCFGLAVAQREAGRARYAFHDALQALPGADLSFGEVPRFYANPFRSHEPSVERVRDIVYTEAGGVRLKLDIYRRRGDDVPRPVLLQVHGGAWLFGSKNEQGLPLMRHLAARGWICVSASYRLSPRATFPDPLLDLKQAIRWVRENIAAFGGDASQIVLTGGSAGGHLAALTALTANRPEYQPGFEGVDTSVLACVPVYGVYDFTNRHKHFDRIFEGMLTRLIMKKSRAQDPGAYEAASPLSQVHPDAPPFFVIHGEQDSLVPVREARRFVESLRAVSRAPVLYAELPGAQHAYDVFLSRRTAYHVRAVERFLQTILAQRARP